MNGFESQRDGFSDSSTPKIYVLIRNIFSSFGLVLDYPVLYTLSPRSIPLSPSVQTMAKAGAGDLWALASGSRFWHRLHGWTTSLVSMWVRRPTANWNLQCSIGMWRNAKWMACLSRQIFWDTQMENKSFFSVAIMRHRQTSKKKLAQTHGLYLFALWQKNFVLELWAFLPTHQECRSS